MESVFDLFETLKTTRKTEFNQKKISEGEMDKIKDAIFKTSNASNRQSYSIIELDTPAKEKLNFKGDRVLIYCIDFYRLKRCADKLNKEFNSQYFMQFTTALIDISLLVQSTVLTAQSLGIQTLITNEVYHKKIDAIFEHLELPENYVFPMIAVCMGYTDVDKPTKGRLQDHIFYKSRYIDYTDEDIDKIIQTSDSVDMNIGLIKNWKEKGYNHYYEWFFDKWSKGIGTEEESEKLVAELIKHKMI